MVHPDDIAKESGHGSTKEKAAKRYGGPPGHDSCPIAFLNFKLDKGLRTNTHDRRCKAGHNEDQADWCQVHNELQKGACHNASDEHRPKVLLDVRLFQFSKANPS